MSEPPPFPASSPQMKFPPPPRAHCKSGNRYTAIFPRRKPTIRFFFFFFAQLFSSTACESRSHPFPFAVFSVTRKRYPFTAGLTVFKVSHGEVHPRTHDLTAIFLHRYRAALATRLRSLSKMQICIIRSILFKRSFLWSAWTSVRD